MTFMDQTNLRAVKFKVYFIRFCRGDTKSHIQWTGRHLGYTDRASDIHYIFTSEITQPKYHLITSHLVPTVIHHKKLTTQLLTHHKYLGETWTGHLGCARKKVKVFAYYFLQLPREKFWVYTPGKLSTNLNSTFLEKNLRTMAPLSF